MKNSREYNQSRNSDRILMSSKGFAESICAKGDFGDKLEYFPNWPDGELAEQKDYQIPTIPDGFKVMFAGNIRMTDPNANKVTFDDVAGADEEKEELREVVDFLRNPDKFTKIGARIPHGLLLGASVFFTLRFEIGNNRNNR